MKGNFAEIQKELIVLNFLGDVLEHIKLYKNRLHNIDSKDITVIISNKLAKLIVEYDREIIGFNGNNVILAPYSCNLVISGNYEDCRYDIHLDITKIKV